ncbi:hypothetical protein LRH25_29205 [Ideonella azotifigens]|uniref:Glycosyltransferase family 2 protein n=3 Tax=Ideonella azotifigens TaxID=513160 RepID=A0ABN1K536_9BURK|nr:hypothetical protein [Ideonella azotifigens]MCD2344408.1 hypothetical protein [Ideonella azotifigens]
MTPPSPIPLQPWHRQAGTDWYRLQGIDRSMLGAQQLYLAGSEGLMLAASQAALELRADDWLGSGTLRNSFYVEPWAQLSTARELALVLDAQGSFRVRVMRASRGQTPVVLRELHVDSASRSCHALPLGSLSALPENSRLFWHVDAIDGARIHQAAWCTRARPRERLRLAVLLRTWGRTHELQAQLERLAQGAQEDPFHAELLGQMQFWVLDTSADAGELWPATPTAALGLNLRVLTGPNLGGGGNASHLIHQLLQHCDATPKEAPQEVLILDDDLVLSMESLARHFMACAYRAVEHVASLPVLMKSKPTQVWEDGGFWGRLNFHARGDFGRKRNLFPHLLKHGLSLENFAHLDEFGPLNHCEYTTFIFFALPLATLRRIGLPAAFFLRGDDIEFSLRAQAAGVPVITNPNLAAWHEPGHSYGQEYMAILHAVLINLTHSDGGAAELARWFEQRMVEHGSIDDLAGMQLYLRVLETLLDRESLVLTPQFEQHYLRALPACLAARMSPLPEADRQRLERDAGDSGVLLRPFVYPGYQPDAARHRAVVLVNGGAGSYRELPPVTPAERLALMTRYLAALSRWVQEFDALQPFWQQRLAASGRAEFWCEVAQQHAAATQLLAETSARRPAPGTGRCGNTPLEALPVASRSHEPALPQAVPVRELRQRMERELANLTRLRRQAAGSEAEASSSGSLRGLAGWWHDLRRPTASRGNRRRSAHTEAPLPADFDPAQYLALNADVARTGMDPGQHYARFGRGEGRRYRL